jgi:Gti1/Pac2 family transcription factor
MRRWTDGKSWSASRVSGSFLTYREMEGKRGASSFPLPNKTADTQGGPQQEEAEEGPDGYRYKPDGLMKQSFSITTSQGQHLHLISYFARSHATAPGLNQPSTDPSLRSIRPQKGMYPESSINDQSNVPAVTRSPMVGAPNYGMAPQAPAYTQSSQPPQAYMPYAQQPQQHPAYQYPQSPMGAPPYHYPGYSPSGLPPPGYPTYGQAPPQMNGYSPANQVPPPNAYDQRPVRTSETSQPPLAQTQAAPTTTSQPYQNGGSGYTSTSAPAQKGHPTYPPAAPNQYEQQQPAPQQQLPPRASPAQQAAAALQIDPRLTAAAALASPVPPTNGLSKEESSENKENSNATNASQAPKITSLVNGSSDASSDGTKQDSEEKGSTSPGGTKDGGPIQDIPSEKLGFREDKRALRQLDKVFAASAR